MSKKEEPKYKEIPKFYCKKCGSELKLGGIVEYDSETGKPVSYWIQCPKGSLVSFGHTSGRTRWSSYMKEWSLSRG